MSTATRSRPYITGFCGVRHHTDCPHLIRSNSGLITTCTCTCHHTPPAAAGTPTLQPASTHPTGAADSAPRPSGPGIDHHWGL